MFKTSHNCIIKFPSWYFTLGSQNSNKRERKPHGHTLSMHLYFIFLIVCLLAYLLTFLPNYIQKAWKARY